MKPTQFLTPITLSAGLLLVSCKNPADETTDAEVGDKLDDSKIEIAEGAVKYVFTENSKIEFEGSKVTGSHTGGFSEFTGHFYIKDGEPVAGGHEVVIDMNSLYSDNDKLTGHLKSADFFDVEKFATTTFDAVTIEKVDDSNYTVTGNLDLHGVTKSITFPATGSHSDNVAKITAEFDINRYDWGIEYKGKPDDLIRKEVILRFDLEAKPE